MISHSNTFIANTEVRSVDRVIKSGLIIAGAENRLFRKEFAEYVGAEYVKLTGSGTLAFFLILKALGIQIGDEVLLPDYICKDLLGPIRVVGARAVIYDNKENSWLSSESEILSKVTNLTKVVVVNNTFGFRFNDINTLSSKLPSSVKIVEDCCHAIFSKRSLESLNVRNNSLCSFYSFNATKLLAAGEGGAISTNDEAFFKEIQKIDIGDKLSDISCILARTQLKKLDKFIEKRNKIASVYLKEFEYLLTTDYQERFSLFFRFPLMIPDNEEFLKSKIVAYRKGVDSLLSQHLGLEALPNAKLVFDLTVSIPIYPGLPDKAVWTIVNETKRILRL